MLLFFILSVQRWHQGLVATVPSRRWYTETQAKMIRGIIFRESVDDDFNHTRPLKRRSRNPLPTTDWWPTIKQKASSAKKVLFVLSWDFLQGLEPWEGEKRQKTVQGTVFSFEVRRSYAPRMGRFFNLPSLMAHHNKRHHPLWVVFFVLSVQWWHQGLEGDPAKDGCFFYLELSAETRTLRGWEALKKQFGELFLALKSEGAILRG